MGFLNPGYDDDYRIQSMPGTTDVPAAGALEGSLSAIPKGLASATAKLYDLGADISDSAAGKYLRFTPGFAQLQGLSQEDRQRADAQAKVIGEWGATGADPRVTGTVGRIAAGTTEGLAIGSVGAVAGPWGAAALLGATEGHASYKEGVTQGLNPGAALDQATLTGLFSAAGALVPMKFGSTALTSILGGGAANIGLGAAQRGLTSAALEADGYPEQAKQYRIFDGEAMAADAILGGAFGAMGHFTHPDSPSRTSPADVDTALAMSAEDHFNRSGPGIPTDPATATLHADTMAAAMRSLADGDLPDVPPERAQQLVDNVIPDPMHSWASALPPSVVRAYHGTTTTFGDKFSLGEGIGPHFGTIEQASKFAVGEGGHIRPVDLHFKNTLRLPDGGWENPSMLLLKLEREGVISEDEMLPTVPFRGRAATPEEHAADVAAVRSLIQSKGYDSIVYRNEHEGEGDSYIALNPDEQVQSSVAPKNVLHEAALEDLPGYADAIHEVPRMELPPETVPPPKVEPEPPLAAAGEVKPQPDVPLDPFHADALDHLVHNYPDETYLTDDGREVSYRQMADEMQKQRNEADTFAKLHDVAAACAARNGV